MAIDYGNTIMEGGIEPSVRVQAPVQDDSGAVLAESLGGAARTVGAIAGSIFQQNQQNASTKILTGYESELLDLADAVDQGMSKNEAMIRARNIRRQYLGNSPDLQADFDKIWTNFATSNGLGHVVVEGTIQDQAEDAINLEAAKLGYTRQQYDVVRARTRELQAIGDQMTMIQNQNGIITESMKAKGLQAVIGVADAAFPAAQSQINTAMQQINNNPAQRGAIAQQTITSLRSQVAAIEGAAVGTDATFITKPINDLLKTFEDWSNNSVESSVIENQIKFTQLQYDAMATKDPVLGPFIAASALLKSVGLENSAVAAELLNDEVIKALRDGVDPNRSVNILSDSVGTNKVVQSVTNAISMDLDEAAVSELQTFLGGVIDGAYVNERANKDGALGYKGTVELLGSNQMKDWVRKNGPIPSEHADALVGVLKENYESELLPVIQSYWSSVPVVTPSTMHTGDPNATAGGMQNLPMNQLLDVVWNGNAVEFIPKQEWANNPRIIALANDVNAGDDSIGVPLNNLINAHAILTETDAKSVWEQQFAGQLFNIGGEDQGEVLTELSVLPEEGSPTIGDFNPEQNVQFEDINALASVDALPESESPGLLNSSVGGNWLVYNNQGATRNRPINRELETSLSFLSDMGITMEVFSGGQGSANEGGPRVGSIRHDHGNSADVFFYKDGRKLDWSNSEDRKIFQQIVRTAKANGVTGFGAGPGYMRPGSMHIGFGSPAVWGAGGSASNAPQWLREAFNS